MKTIILPGFSVSNKEWAEKTAKQLSKAKIKTAIHHWKHWTGSQISPRDQIQDIIDQIGDNQVNIIAKSIGSYILMLLIPKIKDQIEKIIICGIPINDLSEDDQEKYRVLSDVDSQRIICFQNKDDNHGSYDQIKDFVNGINSDIDVISKPASTHEYPYSSDFIEFLLDK